MSTPNAIGEQGCDSIRINLDKVKTSWKDTTNSITDFIISFEEALNPQAKDSITLMDSLDPELIRQFTETSVDSEVFSAEGHWQIELLDYAELSEQVDSIRCRVHWTTDTGSSGTFEGNFAETSPISKTFRHTTSLAALNEEEFSIHLASTFNENELDQISLSRSSSASSAPELQLLETANNSMTFEVLSPEGNLVRIEFHEPPELTSIENQIECDIELNAQHVGSPIINGVFYETGTSTNSFKYIHSYTSIGYGSTVDTVISSVENKSSSSMGTFKPLAVRFRDSSGYPLQIKIEGQQFESIEAGGIRFASRGEEIVRGIVAITSNGPEFIYRDGSTLSKFPVNENGILAELSISNVQEAYSRVTANQIRANFVTPFGKEVSSIEPVPISMLVQIARGNLTNVDAKLSPANVAKVRVYNDGLATVSRVASEESPGEFFDILTQGAVSESSRFANFSTRTTYIESEQFVVVYNPDSEFSQISDADWLALKELGYLAIHNPELEMDVIVNKAGQVVDSAGKVIEDFQKHHIFNQWKEGTDPKYRDFWLRVFGKDFDVHDYVVPVDKAIHQGKSSQITAAWKAFIDEQDEILKSDPGKLKSVAKATVQKALDLADEFGYDISKVRRYRAEAQAWGQSLDKLWKLHNRFGKINMGKHAQWLRIAKRAGSRFGSKLSRILPVVGVLVLAYTVYSAIENPPAAIAAELDCSEEEAQALLDGNAIITPRNWIKENTSKCVVLEDGGAVAVGDVITVWFWVDANDHSKGTRGKEAREVLDIRTGDVPGSATLFFSNGEGNRPLEVRGVTTVFGPIPDN